jgi:3-phosphoglycerate kinase
VFCVFPQIGSSLFDQKGAEIVEGLLQKAARNNVKLHLPIDHVAADKYDKNAQVLPALATSSPVWTGTDPAGVCWVIFCVF